MSRVGIRDSDAAGIDGDGYVEIEPAGTLPRGFGPLMDDGAKRYELRRVLGHGAQGCVYEAVDWMLGEPGRPEFVALKIFHRDAVRDRAKTEASRSRSLRHASIARVYEFGDDPAGPYMTSELIEGLPLDRWVDERGGVTPVEATRIALGLARAVEHAHASGVVHRDLKPSNVLVRPDATPVLTDLGISARIGRPSGQRFGTRGSLAFMAPEQYRGDADDATPVTDVYGLGGLLLWLLTGSYPNGTTPGNAGAFLGGTGARSLPPLGGLPPGLDGVVQTALRDDPGARYRSASLMVEDLQRVLEHKPVSCARLQVHTRAWMLARRRPWAVGATALAVVGVIGASWAVSEARSRARIAALNAELRVESERIATLKQSAAELRRAMEGWIRAASQRSDPNHETNNMLVMLAIVESGVFEEDPEFAWSLVMQRIDAAEAYVERIESEGAPPLLLGLWHRLISEWYASVDEAKSLKHGELAQALLGDALAD